MKAPQIVPFDQDPVVYAMAAGITLASRNTSIHGNIPQKEVPKRPRGFSLKKGSTSSMTSAQHGNSGSSSGNNGGSAGGNPADRYRVGEPTAAAAANTTTAAGSASPMRVDTPGAVVVTPSTPTSPPTPVTPGSTSAMEGPYVFAEKYEFLSTCAFPPETIGHAKKASNAIIEFKAYYPSLFERIRVLNSQIQSNSGAGAGAGTTAAAAGSSGASGAPVPPPLVISDQNQLQAELAYRSSFTDTGSMVSYGALANSGSRFYYTTDKRYIVKTIPYVQMRFLQSILHRYTDYLVREPNSLLIRIQALYRITWRVPPTNGCSPFGGKRKRHCEYLVVMSNCLSRTNGFQTISNGNLMDPPGTPSAQAIPKELTFDMKAWGLKHPRDTRDLNELLASNRKLKLSADEKERMQKQAKRDGDFLALLGVNDYSILLGIMKTTPSSSGDTSNKSSDNKGDATSNDKPDGKPNDKPVGKEEPTGPGILFEVDHAYAHPSTDKDECYYLSLIDLLSDWTWNRQLGYYLMPRIWIYFPRYIKPSTYSKRMLMTLDRILQ